MIVELSISDLTVGMYVVDITVPKDKFTLARETWISEQRVIDALKRKGVEKLLVDPTKAKIPVSSKPALSKPHAFKSVVRKPHSLKRKKPTNLNKPSKPIKRSLFKEEVKQAKLLFDESKAIQQRLFLDARNGVPLSLEPVQEVTNRSMEMIFDNPDALACVINIRHKDQYLLEHSVSVSVLMTIFAFYLKMDKEVVSELAIGAFLHDVGKIMISPKILDKPGRLTDEEFEVMKTHANHSIRIIKETPNISLLSLEVAKLHHEKLNGKGYPYGVEASEISLYGRMISICDIYDALTANRCYKDGYPQVKAFSILRMLGQNNELDVDLVDHFIKCMGVYPVGALVQLESNRLAIVESHNLSDPIRPMVKPFYHLNPNHFESCEHIDLAAIPEDLIVKCVRPDDFDLNMDEIMTFLSHEG
ncbi:HD-GYP domain-containing protein [Shewanella psychrotolerans]|uniref:HD-GYP domain-containing protein n=1 Tax=Shewanella psychrotolerans TaxID=2864206 RepID=UPI001C659387|nr:HD-GYP domain-containing protein [Shewanella psychrotolerans]QYK02880.1 HD-GYP domain-containing protein [Shewanella psychrotolerans]